LNTSLDGLAKQSSRHEQQLAALDRIDQKLAAWESKEVPSATTIGSILQQTQRLNAQLDAVAKQLAKHEQHLAFLDQIHQLLNERDWDQASGDCFDDPESQEEPRRRIRTAKMRAVFFDRDDARLSAWAEQDLSWFLVETRGLPGKLVIHGSADPQGTAERNVKLAQQRAEAIESYVRKQGPWLLPIEKRTAAPSPGEPKSEPYKRVTMIRFMLPCR
jgi:outer membrane protein OmpA-like peptidoglycan-associated protein